VLKEFEIAGYDMPCVDLAVNVDVFPKPNGGTGKRYELAGRRKSGHRHGGGSQIGS